MQIAEIEQEQGSLILPRFDANAALRLGAILTGLADGLSRHLRRPVGHAVFAQGWHGSPSRFH